MDKGDLAVRMLVAIGSGKTMGSLGIGNTPENQTLWDEIDQSIRDMPAGRVLDVPFDYSETPTVAVGKTAKGLVAAGLVVQAADTGRVLMLQRTHTEDDPAAGSWEFPGGCLEPGEGAEEAARREWAEETGCRVPDGDVTGEWTSPNGVYHGTVLTVPNEDAVPIFDGRDQISNPDDPDGDQIEALAWWDPDHLKDNPAVRPELSHDVDTVLSVLGTTNNKAVTSFLAQVSDLTKVGPKGYIHGWIFVGIPAIGAKVFHPTHGHGTVTAHSESHVAVRFDKGNTTRMFEHHGDKTGAPELKPREKPSPHEEAPNPPGLRELVGGTPEQRDQLKKSFDEVTRTTDQAKLAKLRKIHVASPGEIYGDNFVNSDATHHAGTYEIHVNPRVFNEGHAKHEMSYGEDSGWYSKTGRTSYLTRVLDHELGHHYDSLLDENDREDMFKEFSKHVSKETGIVDIYDLSVPDFKIDANAFVTYNKGWLINHVGTYSASDSKELVAELWAEYNANPFGSGKLAQITGKYLTEPVSASVIRHREGRSLSPSPTSILPTEKMLVDIINELEGSPPSDERDAAIAKVQRQLAMLKDMNEAADSSR